MYLPPPQNDKLVELSQMQFSITRDPFTITSIEEFPSAISFKHITYTNDEAQSKVNISANCTFAISQIPDP